MECSEHIEKDGYQELLTNAFHKQYAEGSDEWTNDDELRCIPAIVQGSLKLGHGARFLDLGCGAGADAEYLASIYAEGVAVDLCAHAAWSEVSMRRPNISFKQGDVLSAQLQGQFDLVLDNGCFHHQHPERYGQYLDLVENLLAEQGTLAISTFKNDALRERVDGNGRLHRYFTDSELADVLEKSGLRQIESIDIYRLRKSDFYRLSFVRRC